MRLQSRLGCAVPELETLVFRLRDEAFRRGEFRYDLLVEVKTAGKVEVKGYVIPFLAPIAGKSLRFRRQPHRVGGSKLLDWQLRVIPAWFAG